ncbi:GNAT family N-acetyltransferase [Oceanibaculum indicum]|uniref:Ribosomal protein S18 acetylase RimI-like enzyme n=1 Tax=Oceanibaculum indicum TaxID=526216 RepID=A0A420WAP7_9PROT|nr:GNAT family N-acetyltransferase [Oceanibaculum indicum]RKQ68045.1 ribosomal protein S18 acetylase RimI-like enzyme [Oceanibaculum indicum]
MKAQAILRPLTERDRPVWQSLWDGYCAFYKVRLPAPVIDGLWEKLTGGDPAIHGMLAESAETGEALGLMHYVLHPHTWSLKTVCYLEDLFVTEAARGQGVGRALIEWLAARGRDEGWFRLYWHTDENNETARLLYDRVAGPATMVRYAIPLTK